MDKVSHCQRLPPALKTPSLSILFDFHHCVAPVLAGVRDYFENTSRRSILLVRQSYEWLPLLAFAEPGQNGILRRFEFLRKVFLCSAEVESGSRDREVARRFWFRRNRKAVARFQAELSFRILEEIHWS
jgi:hypothetical protein